MQSAGEYALKRVFLFVFKRALGRLVVDELDLVAVRASPRGRVQISHPCSADVAPSTRRRRECRGRCAWVGDTLTVPAPCSPLHSSTPAPSSCVT